MATLKMLSELARAKQRQRNAEICAAVACPKCHAKVGELCRSIDPRARSGSHVPKVHYPRVDDYITLLDNKILTQLKEGSKK